MKVVDLSQVGTEGTRGAGRRPSRLLARHVTLNVTLEPPNISLFCVTAGRRDGLRWVALRQP